jgi:uncharacterized membrane protein YgcG
VSKHAKLLLLAAALGVVVVGAGVFWFLLGAKTAPEPAAVVASEAYRRQIEEVAQGGASSCVPEDRDLAAWAQEQLDAGPELRAKVARFFAAHAAKCREGGDEASAMTYLMQAREAEASALEAEERAWLADAVERDLEGRGARIGGARDPSSAMARAREGIELQKRYFGEELPAAELGRRQAFRLARRALAQRGSYLGSSSEHLSTAFPGFVTEISGDGSAARPLYHIDGFGDVGVYASGAPKLEDLFFFPTPAGVLDHEDLDGAIWQLTGYDLNVEDLGRGAMLRRGGTDPEALQKKFDEVSFGAHRQKVLSKSGGGETRQVFTLREVEVCAPGASSCRRTTVDELRLRVRDPRRPDFGFVWWGDEFRYAWVGDLDIPEWSDVPFRVDQDHRSPAVRRIASEDLEATRTTDRASLLVLSAPTRPYRRPPEPKSTYRSTGSSSSSSSSRSVRSGSRSAGGRSPSSGGYGFGK